MPARKGVCMECRTRTAARHKRRCVPCWLRHQPIEVQVAAAAYRRSLVPDKLAPARVSPSYWPPGQRWCGGCRSFVDLVDVPAGGARCRACASGAAHLRHVEDTYGLGPDDYAELVRRQGGKCAICRAVPRTKRLAVDHDHKSGAVRGLLCSRCNHDLLGAARDSLELLTNAVAYLTHPPSGGEWSAPEEVKRPAVKAEPLKAGAPFALTADDAYRLSGSKGELLIYVRRDAVEAPF